MMHAQTFHQSNVLLGRDTNLKSDVTFDMIISLAVFSTSSLQTSSKEEYPKLSFLSKLPLKKKTLEAYKYIEIVDMSYDKFMNDRRFYVVLKET